MIVVIDDRQKRQDSLINNVVLNEAVKILNRDEIKNFQNVVKKGDYMSLHSRYPNCNALCLHATSLFDDKELDKRPLIDFFNSKGVPTILFSGGYQFCSKGKNELEFTMSRDLFYANLRDYDLESFELKNFLFGENWFLISCLRLRRRFKAAYRSSKLEELIDDKDDEYSEPQFDSFFENLNSMLKKKDEGSSQLSEEEYSSFLKKIQIIIDDNGK